MKRHSACHQQKRRHSATVVDQAVGVLFKDNSGFWVVKHRPLKHSPGFAIVRTASAEAGGLRHIEERQVTVPCLFGEQPCLSLCTMWSSQSKAANYTKLAAPARDNSCCVSERWLRGANGRAQQFRFGVGPNQDEADDGSFGSRRLVHSRELDRVQSLAVVREELLVCWRPRARALPRMVAMALSQIRITVFRLAIATSAGRRVRWGPTSHSSSLALAA